MAARTRTPTETFTLFPLLPCELRHQIYTQTLPPPLTIPIRFSFHNTHPHYHTADLNDPIATPHTTKYHPLLHINRETRAHYLSTHTNLILHPSYPSTIYANLRIDTLFFDSLSCSPGGDLAYDLERSPHRDAIKRVAFTVDLWEILRVFRFGVLSEVAGLGGLETMALVLGGERDCDGEGFDNDTGEGQTLSGLIEMANGYVAGLRREIANARVERWEERGTRPSAQLWIC